IVGLSALFAPQQFARNIRVAPEGSLGLIYVTRMFGARTVVIGSELLLPGNASRRRALRFGVAIHMSDAIAAAVGGFRRQLPVRGAINGTLLSSLNALLAIVALKGYDRPAQ